ncbi:hypothetical protein [Burkholderia sp. Ax-1719]|uniref:hypothetical protein n=1 Tax=Burkholderia sp. Ax-1719 TaxID=2608334 RepID=UPI0014226032|nr:hypothetical protein [Burkholderia sp. Ax-1719]NIE63468.1 hypothetical protein [Burkholderia sp. Ax-1719]
MSLTINTANTISLTGADSSTGNGASLSSAALASQTASATASPDSSTPITVTAVDPLDHSRIDKYLSALGAPLKMGADAEQIANALVPVMQSLIKERPDLASADFDFSSNDGSIAVSSKTMNAADQSWLQDKLNSSAPLVQAVKAYHDDAVAGYATWADADGNPLSASETAAVSKQADKLTSFMSLFSALGSEAQRSLMKGGTYHLDSNTTGSNTLNLAQDPGNATGFLQFMKSVNAAKNGTATFTSTSGHTWYGVLRVDIFLMGSKAIPNFFPQSDTRSLGIDETV